MCSLVSGQNALPLDVATFCFGMCITLLGDGFLPFHMDRDSFFLTTPLL